ncbi:DNA polymerase III subunit delta [Thalassospiraceae bacterium LMO-JJ14]|nr:DNA polymerase III subunit delta [Thalassospiraceae bacterium LMO-JJ14]
MKLGGAKAASFVKSPDAKVRGVLLFGPDAGLIRERAKALIEYFADASDPFAITELGGDALRKDGALLSDAANAMSLMGSAAVVNVRDITDSVVDVVAGWLDAGAGVHPAIFEAGELSPRSKIRSLFESRSDAAAIGCYPDEGRDLAGVVREHFSAASVRLDNDALPILLARLGTDRLAVRQELDKLIMYAGGPGSDAVITAADIITVIGDAKTASLDDIAFAVGGGDQNALGTAMDRAFSEGATAVGVIRAVQRHLDRLHQAKSHAARDGNMQGAIKKLRPPVFFKVTGAFESQARAWAPNDLARALHLLLETERDCKSGLDIERAICERALLQLTQAARRFGR